MKSVRANFDKASKEEMWARANGNCEICHQPFAGRRPHYHHWPVPAALLNRKATAKDGKCICQPCHKIETKRETVPMVAKAKRLESKRAGTKAKPTAKIPARPFERRARDAVEPSSVGAGGHRAHIDRMAKIGKNVLKPWFLK